MKNILRYDVDDILDLVGLERRSSVSRFLLPVLGFAIGAGVGAAAGLMFAPSSGRRFRQEVGDRIDQVRERIVNKNEMNATAQG